MPVFPDSVLDLLSLLKQEALFRPIFLAALKDLSQLSYPTYILYVHKL